MSSLQKFSSWYKLKDPQDKSKTKAYYKAIYFDPAYLRKVEIIPAEWIGPEMYVVEIKYLHSVFENGALGEGEMYFDTLEAATEMADKMVLAHTEKNGGMFDLIGPPSSIPLPTRKNVTILKQPSLPKDEDDK